MTNPTCSKRTLWSIAGLLFFATAAISFAHRDPAGGALWATIGALMIALGASAYVSRTNRTRALNQNDPSQD